MTSERPIAGLIDFDQRLLSRRVFFEEEIYQEELARVFAQCWLFLGHESQIPEPGDFFTNYMGEDPVLVTRDREGSIRGFLNSCRHRGMRLCREDHGSARTFVCPFHGWSYDTGGRLVGVPYDKESYHGRLDRDQWALHPIPKIANYGGFLFGSWDAGAVSLDQYLGDFRWYLDISIERAIGGWRAVPGFQRYRQVANWKLAAENFAGDVYHLPYSHGSVYRLDIRQVSPLTYAAAPSLANVRFDGGHNVTGIATGAERFEKDLEEAEQYGAEVVDYVRACRDRLEIRLSKAQADVFALGFGNVFPNFSHNNFSALRPFGLYLWHPRSAQTLEAWQWCLIDAGAPEAVQKMARLDFARAQAAAGIAAQDDTENFEQVTEATRGVVGQTLDFNYQMGMHEPGDGRRTGYPGFFGAYFSEHNQWNFYRRWAGLMGEPERRIEAA